MPSEKIKNAVSSIFLIENSDYMQLKDNIEILTTLIEEEQPVFRISSTATFVLTTIDRHRLGNIYKNGVSN